MLFLFFPLTMTDLSTCCGKPFYVEWDYDNEEPFRRCTECGKACDVAHEFPDPHWDEACVKCGGFDGEPCEPPREHTSNRGNSVLLSFIAQGRAGRSCVYATPEGNFLSPEAVRRKVEAAKREAKIEVLEELERKYANFVPQGNTSEAMLVDELEYHSGCLIDAISSLKQQ